jgi:hypothetical protein
LLGCLLTVVPDNLVKVAQLYEHQRYGVLVTDSPLEFVIKNFVERAGSGRYGKRRGFNHGLSPEIQMLPAICKIP